MTGPGSAVHLAIPPAKLLARQKISAGQSVVQSCAPAWSDGQHGMSAAIALAVAGRPSPA